MTSNEKIECRPVGKTLFARIFPIYAVALLIRLHKDDGEENFYFLSHTKDQKTAK